MQSSVQSHHVFYKPGLCCLDMLGLKQKLYVTSFNSTDQKKGFSNGLDPDEKALSIRIYTVFLICRYSCLHFVYNFVNATSLIEIMNTVRNLGKKGLKFYSERCDPLLALSSS